MIEILIGIIIISLFCNGWYLITHTGNIFDSLRLKYLDFAGGIERADGTIRWERERSIFKFIYSPLFGCIVCMSSIWGTIGILLLGLPLVKWPIIVVSVACVNLIINKLYER